MAPRRKRTVLADSDSDEGNVPKLRKTSLRHFFSPKGKISNAANEDASQSVPSSPISITNFSPTVAQRTRSATATASSKTPTKASSAKGAVHSGVLENGVRASSLTSSPLGRMLSSQQENDDRKNGTEKSPFSSPEKKKGGRGTSFKGRQASSRSKNADLVTLFTKQAEKALSAEGSPPKRQTAESAVSDDLILSDADDIIDDSDEIAEGGAVAASYVGSRAQKRWKQSMGSQLLPATTSASGSQSFSSQLPPSSQRFKRPFRPDTKGHQSIGNDDELRPWSERFAPNNLDELAVHKKKVADVRRWLDDALQGRTRQRMLVLKGAAGTGKTTTVRLLAKDMGLSVSEWRNPTSGATGGSSSLGFASAAAQFDEFLNRDSRFMQLDLDDVGSDSDTAGIARPTADTTKTVGPPRRKIIVIEEFPNTFTRSSSSLTGFRNSVLQYLSANTPSIATFTQAWGQNDLRVAAPVVIILSETLLTTASASADSFTAHRLLGPEILRHPGTALIEFNSIAPSLLAKALELVVLKEARKSGRRRTPGQLVLRRLGEVGDVRSAVASLEFLCVKGDNNGDWGAKVAFTKNRKGTRDAALTRGERETLEIVSQREASLGVFHAVGKVVYNRRNDMPPPPGSDEALAEELPDFLAHHTRRLRPLVDADTLIDETGTDTHTFISALHENYALSCEQTGPQDPSSSIDYINGCIENLSESDLLCPTWDIFFGGRGTSRLHDNRSSGSHVLRQDEMAFQVAVRGLLFSLPSPVKRSSAHHYQRGARKASNSGGGGDQFKMFYPMSLKLWRSREELEALVDMWSAKLLKGELTVQPQQTQLVPATQAIPVHFQKPKFVPAPGKVMASQSSNRLRDVNGEVKSGNNAKAEDDENDDTAPLLLSLGSSARKEMILERLPYMALLARSRKKKYCSVYGSTAGGGMGLRDLEKVVSFHGIGGPSTTDDDDGDDDGLEGAGSGRALSAEDAWATDKPADDSGNSPRKTRRRVQPDNEDDTFSSGVLPMYKLVLSDDDIEEVD